MDQHLRLSSGLPTHAHTRAYCRHMHTNLHTHNFQSSVHNNLHSNYSSKSHASACASFPSSLSSAVILVLTTGFPGVIHTVPLESEGSDICSQKLGCPPASPSMEPTEPSVSSRPLLAPWSRSSSHNCIVSLLVRLLESQLGSI